MAEYRNAHRDELNRKAREKRAKKKAATSATITQENPKSTRSRQDLDESIKKIAAAEGEALDPDDPRWKNSTIHIVHHRTKPDYRTQSTSNMKKILEKMRRDKQKAAEIIRRAAEIIQKKDAEKACRKTYYQNHKDELAKKQAKYYRENCDSFKRNQRKYYRQHKEYYREYARKYRESHREYFREYGRKYRAKKRGELIRD